MAAVTQLVDRSQNRAPELKTAIDALITANPTITSMTVVPVNHGKDGYIIILVKP